MRARLLTAADLYWYVLRVPPQKEQRVADQLRRRGWDVFLPVEHRYRKKTRYCKSKVAIPYPLMPGYVLLGSPSMPVPWLRIFEHSDATSVIGYQGRPTQIQPAVIDRLLGLAKMSHWDRPAWEKHMPTYREFGVGDEVVPRMMPGQPFKVEAIRDKKVKLMLGLFGREHEVWVDIAQVDAVA